MQGTLIDAAAEGWAATGLFTEMFKDTNPDAISKTYSSAYKPDLGPGPDDPGWTGFGPGPYTGNYTGQGDRVYWGPYDDSSSSSSSSASNQHPDAQAFEHLGPGYMVQDGTTTASRSGSSLQSISENASTSFDPGVLNVGKVIEDIPSSAGTSSGTSSGGTTEMSSISSGAASQLTEPGLSLSGKWDGGSGSVEMQPMGKSQSVETLFDKYYDPDAPYFRPSDIIAKEYGISLESANGSEYENLRRELREHYYENDYFDGDAASASGIESQTTTDTMLGGGSDLPANGGSIELQPLGDTPGEPSYYSEPSFQDSDGFGPTPEPLTRGPGAGVLPYQDTLPSEFGELPPLPEALSFEDFGTLPDVPEFRNAFAESLSDMSNISLGAEGIASDMSRSLQFLQNRGIDLAMGQLLSPVFSWLDDKTDTPWVSRGIQGTLAMYGLLAGGDPFGVIASPILWGVQEYMRQRQRLLDNKDPESERGRKFGYVREGDKWYPAIQTSKTRDEGWIGSNKTQITFQYGTEIKWKKKKGSTEWTPYFEKGSYRMKDFHVWDSEADNPEADAGEKHQKRADPLRDFYYMSEKETRAYLEGVSGGSAAGSVQRGGTYTAEQQAQIQAAQKAAFAGFAVHDDTSWSEWWAANSPDEAAEYSKRGAYIDQLQDVRKSLEFMQGYRYSEQGSVENTDLGADEFEGSTAFRDAVLQEGWLGTPAWARDKTVANPMGAAVKVGYNYTDFSTRGAGSTNFQQSAEMRYLADEFYRQREMLYKTQRAAGLSMGFDKTFGRKVKGYTPEYYGADGSTYQGGSDEYHPFTGDSLHSLDENGWALYQDNTWDFGPLDTSDQLRAAIAKVEASGDQSHMGSDHYRNEDQRAYLAQKAYARYLYSKINQLGGHDYTMLQGPEMKPGTRGTDFRNQDPDRYTGSSDVGLRWALDPMYSAIDDADLPVGSYGTSVSHRSDWVPPEVTRNGQDTSAYHNLVRAGVIGTGTKNNPDYIAGRFDTLEDYNDHLGFENLVYDEATETYVAPGEQTPGSTYNPETNRYEAPDAPAAPVLPTLPEEPGSAEHVDFGGWGTQSADPVDEFGPDGPQLTPEEQEQMDAAAAAYRAEHTQPPPVEEAPKQTVPDEHPGATHVHDTPYEWEPVQHERVHYAPDDTAPAHIPAAIAQGLAIRTV